MAAKIGYRDRKQKRGLATNLEWFHSGRKWRPLLGYDLTDHEKALRATEAVNKILEAITRGEVDLGGSANSRALTLEQAAERWYYKALDRKGRKDKLRPKQCIAHLSKRLPGPIDTINLEAIHGYIDMRQKEGAANGTIRREIGVLSRVLSLSKKHGAIQSNPCKDDMELPEDTERERVVTPQEIRIMRDEATRDLWRMILAALTTGLRRSKLLEIDAEWIRRDKSGQRWMYLPAADTKLKGNAKLIPLCRNAVWALLEGGAVPIRGRIFRRWKQARAFSQGWERLISRCKEEHPTMFDDLRFHDLRHTFCSILQGLGVTYPVVQFMMGHKIKGSTGRYTHPTPEFLAQLLDAVTKLNDWLDEILSKKQTGASATPAVND